MSWKWHLCKLHNEVFKAAESRINTEGLPLVWGDESQGRHLLNCIFLFAPRMRGWIMKNCVNVPRSYACPLQEGMNHTWMRARPSVYGLPLAWGDESPKKSMMIIFRAFAPSKMGWIGSKKPGIYIVNVCLSQEGMKHPACIKSIRICRLPLVWGDEPYTGGNHNEKTQFAPRMRGWIDLSY